MMFENRMAVEGQREYEARYGTPDREYFEDDDHIVLIRSDGSVVYEDGYGPDVVTYCDIYDCRECPRYGDDCDGEFDEEDDE